MEQASHDWIENFADFEAVLVCQNELNQWDRDGVTRAFQTYGWDDGSTPGNDSTFVHEASGVVIRHDGSLTAIDFGHGDLSEAFPDLFEVLHALGWRSAHVYHPTETMSALMVDMGRAIPARLDFDVQAAQAPRAISGFAEGASLLVRSKLVTPSGGMDAVEQTMLDELRSMDEELPASLRPAQPIALVDDNDGAGDLNETVVVAPTAATAGPSRNTFYSEEPALFILPGSEPAGEQSAPDAPQHSPVSIETEEDHPVIREAIAPASFNSQVEPALDARPVARTVAEVVEPSKQETIERPIQVKAQRETACHAMNAAEGKNVSAAPAVKIVKVGHSVVCFDCPGDRLGVAEISAIAEESGIYSEQFSHIRPGALNERIRWNLLGEITPEYPGFAEKLVELMNFGCEDRALIAAIFLVVKQSNPHAQLRDALKFAAISPSEMALSLSTVSPAAEVLIADDRTDRNQITTALIQRLGPLALIPTGQSFIDLSNDKVELFEGVEEAFTVMEVMQSPVPRMFVIHLDELDGPFVRWMVELLRDVACLYSVTKRYKPVQIQIPSAPRVEQVDVEKVKQESTEQALAQVNQLVGGLVKQLQEIVCATKQTSTAS